MSQIQHPPSHLDIEIPLFKDKPHLFIQWKGTDVCCDIWCSCGAHSHFDGDFFYFFKCPTCGQVWECGTHVAIYPVLAERAGGHTIHDPEQSPPVGVPEYASGTAIGILEELANAIDEASGEGVIVSSDDAKAIRWALGCLAEHPRKG